MMRIEIDNANVKVIVIFSNELSKEMQNLCNI